MLLTPTVTMTLPSMLRKDDSTFFLSAAVEKQPKEKYANTATVMATRASRPPAAASAMVPTPEPDQTDEPSEEGCSPPSIRSGGGAAGDAELLAVAVAEGEDEGSAWE